MKTAVLIDGGFFLKRLRHVYPQGQQKDPFLVAKTIHRTALNHLTWKNEPEKILYRIFFYDCPPLMKRAHLPVSKKAIDFSKTDEAKFRLSLHNELKKLRQVALRLGHLSDDAAWILRKERLDALRSGLIEREMLSDEDFEYEVRQKGVDMRIGLDIASLAFKKQVEHIVLIAGDADFVPAAKLAKPVSC